MTPEEFDNIDVLVSYAATQISTIDAYTIDVGDFSDEYYVKFKFKKPSMEAKE